MRKLLYLAASILIFGLATLASAWAAELDSASQEALQKTQADLQNPDLMKQADGGPAQKAALQQIDKITKGDPKKQQQIQSLGSDIFGDIVKQTDGDPAKIQSLLMNAQANPSQFFQSLSPAQREQIQKMAAEMDGKK